MQRLYDAAMKSDLRQSLGRSRVPVLKDLVLACRVLLAQHKTGFLMESRPGDFGSPIPDLKEVKQREAEIFSHRDSVAAIELHDAEQVDLIRRFSELYESQPFTRRRQDDLRYYPENEFFGLGAAFTLHCILRLFRPQRLIEVGSGFSSAAVLDTNDRFLGGTLTCTFIDPFPDRLTGLLRGADRTQHRVLAQQIQEVPLDVFDELESGDVLFIDSSHVSKVGSDLNRLLFDVLPRLKPGVLVHLHDIYFPFEYPMEWIYGGRAWNENYILRAFLMFNSDFKILLFNSYLAQFHADEIAATMPIWAENIGTSLWLRRVD